VSVAACTHVSATRSNAPSGSARQRLDQTRSELDATVALDDASRAEADATDAIDFAGAAIDEAEYAVLHALQAQRHAQALVAKSS